jgi:sulfatase modifying factor 1
MKIPVHALFGFQLLLAGNASAQLSNCLQEFDYQVWVEGGEFVMGQDNTYREESPAHVMQLPGFWIDAHEVTNAQFEKFVQATAYVTVAERTPSIEDWQGQEVSEELLLAGSVVFKPPLEGGPTSSWWHWVPGANWRHPQGPDSDLQGRAHYPVVHIAYEDAQAYANWAGKFLPSEAQFEMAARSKQRGLFAWPGSELAPAGIHYANTWQGNFPNQDTAEDGHQGIAPVGCFVANDYGAHDLIGNVWEWTSSPYTQRHEPGHPHQPESTDSARVNQHRRHTIKGGSFLCAENYCLRFRPGARQGQESSLGTSHIGFRTVSGDGR